MVSHTFNLKQGQADRCELEDSQNCYTKTPYLKKTKNSQTNNKLKFNAFQN